MSAAPPRPASLWLALLPLLLLVALLVANVAVFGDGGLGGHLSP